jgi:CRISPR-associated protein Cas1
VNALLGFAYALLAKNAAAALEASGLDPYVGLYHDVVYGRPALALDLMEEFRPLIADTVVVTLVNRGHIGPQHFEQRLNGWYLTEDGRRTFYQVYEQRLAEEVTHPLFGYRTTYRRMLELQARFLAKVLLGELDEYRALRVR